MSLVLSAADCTEVRAEMWHELLLGGNIQQGRGGQRGWAANSTERLFLPSQSHSTPPVWASWLFAFPEYC